MLFFEHKGENMKGKIAQKSPITLELEPGKYWWCSCGKSTNQPFCDSSHNGSEFTPLPFEIDEKKKVWLCACKQTDNPPFCDGSHNNF